MALKLAQMIRWESVKFPCPSFSWFANVPKCFPVSRGEEYTPIRQTNIHCFGRFTSTWSKSSSASGDRTWNFVGPCWAMLGGPKDFRWNEGHGKHSKLSSSKPTFYSVYSDYIQNIFINIYCIQCIPTWRSDNWISKVEPPWSSNSFQFIWVGGSFVSWKLLNNASTIVQNCGRPHHEIFCPGFVAGHVLSNRWCEIKVWRDALFQFRQCVRTHSKSWPFKISSTYPKLESHGCVTSRFAMLRLYKSHTLSLCTWTCHPSMPTACGSVVTLVRGFFFTRRNMWFCKMNSWKILEICIPQTAH